MIPLAFTCFFEAGCAAIVANAYGGVRGCIIASIVNGIAMVLLVGFGAYFFNNTIQGWMLVYGGQDFSLWGIVEGLIKGSTYSAFTRSMARTLRIGTISHH